MNYTESLIDFLNASPVNFLAVKAIAKQLEQQGYQHLDPAEPLGTIEVGQKFYVTKNGSSIYAFHVGSRPLAEAGFHVICAHCDSPTFRIKPNAEICCEQGITKLNTELYGGAIMSTWFDRPLSLAGRVILRSDDAMHPATRLLHIRRPLLQIPNLAIHFNREVNDGVKLSKQKDMLPLLGIVTDELEKKQMLLNLIAEELQVDKKDIIDFDLYLYDTTPACTFGVHDEFISAGRLDDLSMVHAGLTALLESKGTAEATRILAIFDNEETGSQTKQGAGSPFLASIIQRIVLSQGGTTEDFHRAVEKAFMVSADNAHAWHPNYSDKYDPTNHPVLGGGPVIKFNAAQKYASDALSAAVFQQLCEQAGVPCQRFVNHSDVAGGSTLGNILASSLPLRGVDMGNPILAMHSVRETGAAIDHEYCIKAFKQFYQ
ncbi:MAG: M18 family aminopeptidase [Bacteroidaceae bacterium]|nr:M18 family aminopeptidase [Bacteroidaceae bacterium]MBQ6752121.1 M18 family aminopeptidase [Bacteroidaceae bacterium]